MNPDQLQAYFNAHKPVVLGAAALGVVGLTLLRKKKAAAVTGPTTAGASVQPAGTIPAAAVSPAAQSFGSTYDSSAYDVYNALSGQLEQIRQTSGTGTTTAPAPVASTLFAPSGSGQVVRYAGDGSVYEVQNDGSLFGLTPQQLASYHPTTWDQLSGSMPTKYSTATNLAAKNAA